MSENPSTLSTAARSCPLQGRALSRSLETPVATLLLGMGNTIVSDDAIGVLLARDLGARLAGTPSLDVVEEGPPGTLDLVERLLGYERVIVIDSIRTRDGRPGTWYSFTAAALRGTTNLRNVHDTNFATALELSRQLGLRLPGDDQIHILAVEILQNDTFGESLSPPLAAAYPPRVLAGGSVEAPTRDPGRSRGIPRRRPAARRAARTPRRAVTGPASRRRAGAHRSRTLAAPAGRWVLGDYGSRNRSSNVALHTGRLRVPCSAASAAAADIRSKTGPEKV